MKWKIPYKQYVLHYSTYMKLRNRENEIMETNQSSGCWRWEHFVWGVKGEEHFYNGNGLDNGYKASEKFLWDWKCSMYWFRYSVQFSSVQSLSRVWLCNPMNCRTPGLPVSHQLLEFTQTHVHQVSDAIQPSHPLSSPSPPAPNPSQHQSLFQWVNSLCEVAKVLEFQL